MLRAAAVDVRACQRGRTNPEVTLGGSVSVTLPGVIFAVMSGVILELEFLSNH